MLLFGHCPEGGGGGGGGGMQSKSKLFEAFFFSLGFGHFSGRGGFDPNQNTFLVTFLLELGHYEPFSLAIFFGLNKNSL